MHAGLLGHLSLVMQYKFTGAFFERMFKADADADADGDGDGDGDDGRDGDAGRGADAGSDNRRQHHPDADFIDTVTPATSPTPQPSAPVVPAAAARYPVQMATLADMGCPNEITNANLLVKHNGDVQAVIAELTLC